MIGKLLCAAGHAYSMGIHCHVLRETEARCLPVCSERAVGFQAIGSLVGCHPEGTDQRTCSQDTALGSTCPGVSCGAAVSFWGAAGAAVHPGPAGTWCCLRATIASGHPEPRGIEELGQGLNSASMGPVHSEQCRKGVETQRPRLAILCPG